MFNYTEIVRLSDEEIKTLIIDSFNLLPDRDKKIISSQLARIAYDKPVYVVCTGEKELRVDSISEVRRTIEKLCGKKPDRSNVYKAIRNRKKVCGFQIYKYYEGDDYKE